MHPQTRKCHEFLLWRSRFEDSTDVALEGASDAGILASLNSDERVTTAPLVAERGEAWICQEPLTSGGARPGTCSEQPAYDRARQPCPVRWFDVGNTSERQPERSGHDPE